MRTRAILLMLALSLGSPAALSAQGKPAATKKSKKGNKTKDFKTFRKEQSNKMNGMGANAQENMNPALKGLLSGPDSMLSVTKRVEGMSESERDTFADEWRAKQAKNLGIGGGKNDAPVMSLDELGGSGARAKLVLGSEKERRDMLLEELRTHARYTAKIDRVTQLAKEDAKGADLAARAKGLNKLEAKRHARATIRIRAAKVDRAAAKAAKPADGTEAAPAKGGE